MNQDKLNKLFEMATGTKTNAAEVKAVTATRSKDNAKKIKAKYGSYKGAYTSPAEAWARWYEDSKTSIDSENADDVWSFAEENHPRGKEEARNYLRSQVPNDKDPFLAEANLRNTLTKSPSWLVEEQLPRMNQLGATVSNQNLVKARKIYTESLKNTLSKLDLTSLDPDVPMEVHLNDLVKLEMLGSSDAAQIVNGRFAFANQEGSVQPAFLLESPEEMVAGEVVSPDEMNLIASIVPTVAEPIIKTALQSANSMQEMNNRAAGGTALRMLDEGMPVEQWGDAFSLLGNKDIERAMGGLAVNQDLGYEDLIRLQAEADSLYGDTL